MQVISAALAIYGMHGMQVIQTHRTFPRAMILAKAGYDGAVVSERLASKCVMSTACPDERQAYPFNLARCNVASTNVQLVWTVMVL